MNRPTTNQSRDEPVVMSTKREMGEASEGHAAAWLEAQGFRILARNYRCRLGEIDLVAEEGEYLVFVEVKARTGLARGLPREAVDQRKQHRVQRAACRYAAEHGGERPWRFDVVEVTTVGTSSPEYHLIRDAYQVDERFLENAWE